MILPPRPIRPGRLALSRLRGPGDQFDADALHAVMGAAMAGMLVPRLNVLPDSAWMAVFSIGAAWFRWHAVRAWGARTSGGSLGRFPVPHLIECVAMLYMLLPLHGSRPAYGAGMAMAGMGASAASAGSFPALAVVLALFMLGYIVWTTDRLAALVRARTTPALARTAAPPATTGWRRQHATRRRDPGSGARLAGRRSLPRSPRAASSR